MKSSVVGRLFSSVAKFFGNEPQQPTVNGHQTKKMYHPNKVRLFIKPYCGWCSQAMDWLESHGVEFEVLDVVADEKAYEEMYRLSGQTLAPVIDLDGQILADFGARELAVFWRKISTTTEQK